MSVAARPLEAAQDPHQAPRIGLVLGAGGVIGQGYHAAVLNVLENEWGLDTHAVEVVVGTSAGSLAAALVRLGARGTDLVAWLTGAAPATSTPVTRQLATSRLPQLPPIRPGQLLLRRPSIPQAAMVRRAVLRPWQFRPLAAALALMAPGLDSIEDRLAPLTALVRPEWPDEALWVCAVRRRDGRRIVFGREGSPSAPLQRAVAASCAIPGYFAPVIIGDHAYVDGGAHSPTNATVLRRLGLDLVIVVSPMSGPPGDHRTLYGAARRHAGRMLTREVAALQQAGVPTIVFSPGPDEQAAMGEDPMSSSRLADIVEATTVGATEIATCTEAARTWDTLQSRLA